MIVNTKILLQSLKKKYFLKKWQINNRNDKNQHS